MAANWVADTQLQFSQLSYNDLRLMVISRLLIIISLHHIRCRHQGGLRPSCLTISLQWLSLVVSSNIETSGISDSDDESDGEPRHSGRRVLIPCTWPQEQARALNVKKKRNVQTSQLENDFRLSE